MGQNSTLRSVARISLNPSSTWTAAQSLASLLAVGVGGPPSFSGSVAAKTTEWQDPANAATGAPNIIAKLRLLMLIPSTTTSPSGISIAIGTAFVSGVANTYPQIPATGIVLPIGPTDAGNIYLYSASPLLVDVFQFQ